MEQIGVEGSVVPKEAAMLGWVITFLVVALLAAILGFGDVAAVSLDAARIVFFIAIVLFLLAALGGILRGPTA